MCLPNQPHFCCVCFINTPGDYSIPYLLSSAIPQPYLLSSAIPQPYLLSSAIPQPYLLSLAIPQPYLLSSAIPQPYLLSSAMGSCSFPDPCCMTGNEVDLAGISIGIGEILKVFPRHVLQSFSAIEKREFHPPEE